MSADPASLRELLQAWQFWFLEAQFLLALLFGCLAVPDLVRTLAVGRTPIFAMAGVSLLTFTLVTGVAPRTNRIYYDEHIYQGVGQNLSDAHLAQMCNDGIVEHGVLQCARGEYNKEPYGYPHLLSLGYRIFGVSEAVAHWLNAICAAALAWVVFVIAVLLFGDARTGVLAALVLALIPQQLLWSHTAAAEPSAALMCAVAVMSALFHARRRTRVSLAWMTVMIVYAAQFRMEIALLAPAVLVVFLMFAPRELTAARTWWAGLTAIVLGAAHVAHLVSVRGEDWGSTGERLSIAYFWPNLAVNGPFYLGDPRFPVLFTLLAIAGFAYRPTKAVAVPCVLFVLFWGVFVFFYAGSYNFGADVRFSLMSHAWIAVLAGRGLSHVVALLGALTRDDRRSTIIVASALVVQFLWYVPQVRAVGDEAWAARADVRFAHAVIPSLPRNAIVLTHNPAIFHVNGVNAAQMSLVTSEPAWVTGFLASRYAGGVFLHWNAWCGYADPVQQAFCETTLKSFDSELVAEYRERDFRYAFYRLKTAGTVPKAAP